MPACTCCCAPPPAHTPSPCAMFGNKYRRKHNAEEEEEDLKEVHQKHEYYIQKAAFLAIKSDLVSHKHGCVIVNNRGKIIAEGYNYRFKSMSIHAEVDALSKVKGSKKLLSTCSMYVVRIGTDKMGNPLKYSRPCEKCTEAILKSGIGKVYYSTNYEFALVCSQFVGINEYPHQS